MHECDVEDVVVMRSLIWRSCSDADVEGKAKKEKTGTTICRHLKSEEVCESDEQSEERRYMELETSDSYKDHERLEEDLENRSFLAQRSFKRKPMDWEIMKKQREEKL